TAQTLKMMNKLTYILIFLFFYFISYSQTEDIKQNQTATSVLNSLHKDLFNAIRLKDNVLFERIINDPEFNVNHYPKGKEYPIFYAISFNRIEYLKRLIEIGADVNLQSTSITDFSAIQICIWRNKFELFELLIQNGAILKVYNTNNSSIIDYSLEMRNSHNSYFKLGHERYKVPFDDRIIDLLLSIYKTPYSLKEKQEVLVYSVNSSNYELFKRTLKCFSDKEIGQLTSNETFRIYKESIKNPADHYLNEIIKSGFEINCLSKYQDISPLMYGFSYADNLGKVRILIENGAKIDHLDNSKRNMLHFASENPNPEFSNYLIKNGFDINKTDQLQRIPLFYAIESENTAVIDFLNKNGANFLFRNHRNETSLYFACLTNNLEIVKQVAKYDTNLDSSNGYETLYQTIQKECKNEKIISWLIENLNPN
ncbi:MAG: ankyrin repeat domain-containing protein, partial [Bacteroidota bacterium]